MLRHKGKLGLNWIYSCCAVDSGKSMLDRWLRSFWPLRELGLFWVCFSGPHKEQYFRNLLLPRSLRSFWAFGKLGLFGFELDLSPLRGDFDNSVSDKGLRSFGHLGNWVCFAKK